MTFFFIVFCLGLILLPQIIINVRNDREWHEGLLEKEEVKTEPHHDPLLEAYIHLGALMVRNDISSYSEKILFLNSYFSKHFPHSHYDSWTFVYRVLKTPCSTTRYFESIALEITTTKTAITDFVFFGRTFHGGWFNE